MRGNSSGAAAAPSGQMLHAWIRAATQMWHSVRLDVGTGVKSNKSLWGICLWRVRAGSFLRPEYSPPRVSLWYWCGVFIRSDTVARALLPSGPSDTWEVNYNASICIKVWGMFCWQRSGATVWWPHRFSASTALWLWKKAAAPFGPNTFLMHIRGEIGHCE